MFYWDTAVPICLYIVMVNVLWVCLVAQMVKSLPAMQKTGVQFLGQEDTLEKEMATHCSILAWKIPKDGGAW